MDSNHRYRIRNNPFWLLPFGPAIRLPQQKPALSCRGPMVRIHLPPAESHQRTVPAAVGFDGALPAFAGSWALVGAGGSCQVITLSISAFSRTVRVLGLV